MVSDVTPIDTKVQSIGHEAHVTLRQKKILLPMWLSQPYPLEVPQYVLAHLNPLDVLEVHLVLICLTAPPIIPSVRLGLVHCSINIPFGAPGSPHSEPRDLGDINEDTKFYFFFILC